MPMATVELVYEASCPNVLAARARLVEAFKAAGVKPAWTEWEAGDPLAPEWAKHLGSPTILVDGEDVTGVPVSEIPNCCRVYGFGGADSGVPPLHAIVSALMKSENPYLQGKACQSHG